MSFKKDSFDAIGPTIVAFETLGNIPNSAQVFGVSVTGSQCGVYGESSLRPVGTRPSTTDVPEGTGVAGRGEKQGVKGAGDIGVVGEGRLGVFGSGDPGPGIEGHSFVNDGVVGRSDANNKSGVFGFNSKEEGAAFGVAGACNAPDGAGVGGDSSHGVGVRGHSGNNDGVVGLSDGQDKSGVFGFNSKKEGLAFGVVGQCNSDQGVGVAGGNDSSGGTGVRGVCNKPLGVGVHGIGKGFGAVGVRAETADGGIAFIAEDTGRSGLAGVFLGDLRVFGLKSAAVPHPDGSHRLLYCLESPDSWFEDFGEGRLVDGKAEVQLDPDFASLVEVDGYHVFVTPYEESKGLFVAERYATGFRVCEQQSGTSNVSFAYRVVAKRKDIVADRLATVTPPEVPSKEAGPTGGLPTSAHIGMA